MKEYWKTAFFILLATSIIGGAGMGWKLERQSTAYDLMTEKYEDCKYHRDYLSDLLKLTPVDLRRFKIERRQDQYDFTHGTRRDNIVIQYDSQGHYLASSLGTSQTSMFKKE